MSESLKDDVLEAARDAENSSTKKLSLKTPIEKKEASEREFGSPQFLKFSHDDENKREGEDKK